jgi:hypothetical protein
VRAYNSAWNYCGVQGSRHRGRGAGAGLLGAPTCGWGLGLSAGGGDGGFAGTFRIEGDEQAGDNRSRQRQETPPPAATDDKALAVLGLAPTATRAEIKARYKRLVKRYHPDANGGDRQAEERLKVINQAYSTLRKRPIAV